MPNAWLMLAVGDDRQHGGNDGYDDEPDAYYTWDSTVPNHAAVAVGDRIVLWDKRLSIGMSVIEDIAVSVEPKARHRCPMCGKARFKPRKSAPASVRFRCQECGGEFAEPSSFIESVTVYRSRHDAAWKPLSGTLDAPTLRSLAVSPQSQHSMRALRWDAFASTLDSLGLGLEAATVAERTSPIPGGHVRVMTRVRVGQAAFRRKLLDTMGNTCAVIGQLPETVLEAGHLYSYADLGQHHDHGGLLFRRDIHRLFDCGGLAIEPKSGEVCLTPELLKFKTYAELEGTKVKVELHRDHRAWLGRHWAQYRADRD